MQLKMYTVTLGVVLGLMLTSDICEAKKKIVCYYTNWSNYRQGMGKFTPADIDPSLCTHIIYSFAKLEAGKMIPYDAWLDLTEGGGYGYYDQLVALKQQNPNLKVMVAIGGWNNGGWVFSQMAKTKNGRQIFIKSVMDLLTKYKFDGLDLDWEYPAVGHRGGMPEDKQNFNYLIQELQSEFDSYARRYNEQKMLLSAAVGPAAQTADLAYDRFTVCRDLDFVNLMQYDIHGGWETRTGFNAPLDVVQGEATPQNVIKVSTDQWLKAGCAPYKLILGLPTYGRAWKTSSSMVHNQASGPANPGRFTGESGILSYYEICEKVSSPGQSWMTEYYPQAAEVVGYSSQSGEMVTYDNKRSMSDKVDYINSLGLGGAMIWNLDFDDFTGKFCNEGKYPLLTAINQRLGTSPSRTTRRPTQRPTLRPTQRPTQKTTTTQRPNTPQRTTRRTRPTPPWWNTTTKKPYGSCKPSCSGRANGTFLADRCDERRYHICTSSMRTYTMMCPAGTKFRLNPARCVHA